MKTTSSFSLLCIVGLFGLTTFLGCQDHIAPPFEQQNAPYTAQFAFQTTGQQPGNPGFLKLVVAGTGSYSFAGTGTFTDEIDLSLATGAATHKLTFTATTGDKIYASLSTQIGQASITGTTTFTGGTGRFAKITGGGSNVGPLVNATGAGSWKEEGGTVTF